MKTDLCIDMCKVHAFLFLFKKRFSSKWKVRQFISGIEYKIREREEQLKHEMNQLNRMKEELNQMKISLIKGKNNDK